MTADPGAPAGPGCRRPPNPLPAGLAPPRPIGLSIASHSGLAPARIGELAAAAEHAGFDAVFVAEGHGDALALCHPVAAATSRVRVGTAVANAALRPPVLAAKTAAQLDHAAGGRFVLGLGVGNPIMNGRFGIAPFPPLQMVEEYVAVVRAVLAGSPAGHTGELFRTGMVPLDSPPARRDLPVYLGALGPRMLELAGRIADGVVLNLMSPAQAGGAASLVRRRRGRRPGPGRGGDHLRGALLPVRRRRRGRGRRPGRRPPLRAASRGGPAVWRGRPRHRPAAGPRAAAGRGPGRRDGAGAAAGGRRLRRARERGRVRPRLAEYRAAGVDLPVLFPMPVGGDWGYEEAIASFAPSGPTGPGKEAVPSARNL